MEKKVKIGIIGCGGIGTGKHLPSLAKVPEAEVVAFCDIIPERAEKAAKEFGPADARVYTDYKELLEKEKDIEVIHLSGHIVETGHPELDAVEVFHEGFGGLRVIPEVGGFGLFLQGRSLTSLPGNVNAGAESGQALMQSINLIF